MTDTPSTTTPAVPTDPTTNRPLLVDPATPTAPYPIFVKGPVEQGFQRGSKELGIPTANLPQAGADHICDRAGSRSGIYYGWVSIGSNAAVYPMVMSVGWNPYYKNERRTAEVHIIHKFDQDFYGEELRVVVAGYIRDEKNYTSLDDLILDINTDIKVAHHSLARPEYAALKSHTFLVPSSSSSSSS